MVSDVPLGPDMLLTSVSSVEADLTGALGFFFTRTPLSDFLTSFFTDAIATGGLLFPDEPFCEARIGGLLTALSLLATALQKGKFINNLETYS